MLYGLVLHTAINMHGELHVSNTDVANFNNAFCQPTGGRNVSSNVTFNSGLNKSPTEVSILVQ